MLHLFYFLLFSDCLLELLKLKLFLKQMNIGFKIKEEMRCIDSVTMNIMLISVII